MKRIIILTVCIFALSLAAKAQTETLDATTFTPPAGWTKQAKEGVAMFTNAAQTSYCLIAVYQSKPSSGKIENDFKSEWKELAAKAFNIKDEPTTEPAQENNGWKSIAGTAAFTNEGGTAVALLTTTSGYGITASVLIILNDQAYMPTIENFFNSVSYNKPSDSSNSTGNSPAINSKIVGTWGRKSSVDGGSMIADHGYFKCLYVFNANGTYTVKSERWDGYVSSEKWWTTEENGTFSVNGDSLTISPKVSVVTLRNRSGDILKTQNNSLESIAYQWQLHYYQGINETVLILQSTAQTNRDGKFSSNSNFPNSYIYDKTSNIEWRF